MTTYSPDLRPPSPDFRVVHVRVLQSAYDRIDAMLAGIEPDLRAANSVRIELRHLINESYALSSRDRGGDVGTHPCGEGCQWAPNDPTLESLSTPKCTCGAPWDGKWAGKHTAGCALA